MKVTSLAIALCAVCGSMIFSSCARNDEFVGSWKANSAVSINSAPNVALASLTYIDFFNPVEHADGAVKLSNEYFISEQVVVDSVTAATAQMQMKALVSAEGSWTYDVDDKDDLLLSFDMSSIKVVIGKESISIKADLSEDLRNSIADRLVANWQNELTRHFRDEMSRYSVVDDVEVSKDGRVMSLEVNSPDAEVHFLKVEP